jgi:hypothetical protein
MATVKNNMKQRSNIAAGRTKRVPKKNRMRAVNHSENKTIKGLPCGV